MAALSAKKKRFFDEYLVDYNATQAAKRAGYSAKTAYSSGQRMLKDVEGQKYMQSKKEKIAAKLEITQERTMQEIARIAFSDLRKAFNENGTLKPLSEIDEDTAAVLASVEIEDLFDWIDKEKIHTGTVKKVKVWDKTKALEMLAKHFKIYSDSPQSVTTLKFGYGPEVPV